jgi:hypothetical protein
MFPSEVRVKNIVLKISNFLQKKIVISNNVLKPNLIQRTSILEVYDILVVPSLYVHVGWVPCHHGMARPHVADGGKSSGYGG